MLWRCGDCGGGLMLGGKIIGRMVFMAKVSNLRGVEGPLKTFIFHGFGVQR